MKLRLSLLFGGLLSMLLVGAQDHPPADWFHKDPAADGVAGMSTEKMYNELLKNRKGETVVVAILDSGVDAEHEDLKEVMWVNADEIPGNGVDDDKNGYIDDIHGWNFLGNKNGENVVHDTYEMTRLYVIYKKKYEGKSKEDLKKKEVIEYEQYKEWEKIIEAKKAEFGPQLEIYEPNYKAFKSVEDAIGKKRSEITEEDIKKLSKSSNNPMIKQISSAISEIFDQYEGVAFSDVMNEVEEIYQYFSSQLDYHYNVDYDSRKIVGDNYNDPYEKGYGNNDVRGPDARHGTHVAGIVGAVRHNDVGMDGVADNVRIMSVRTVPDGDERDKDVANAIIYAVDNGASVINMSFGKGASPYKDAVDKAVKYAMKKDVLIVTGSGNDNKEVTYDNSFPNDKFRKKGLFKPKYANNFLSIGATNKAMDESMVAPFSNYSQNQVDVFAPGEEILSTVPDDNYEWLQGTSMSSPMVAGLAAVLRSYFPDLSASQVKTIIMESSNKHNGKVVKPGSEELVSLSQISITGGYVNGYNAVQLAMKTKGKKKNKAVASSSGKSGTSKKDKSKKETVLP